VPTAPPATAHGWTVLDDDPPVLVHAYSIGPGNETNTLVAGFGDRELLVVSPGSKPSGELLEELEPFGRVTALLAPCAFHHAGLPAWHAAFPEAQTYAASGRIDALRKKRADVPIAPVSELIPRLGDRVQAIEAPGMRFGETWVAISGARRSLYVGDAFTNLAEVPWFPLGWMLRPLGLGPGLRRNPLRSGLLVTDRSAHTDWLNGLLDRPPARVIPGHGEVIEADDAIARLGALWAGERPRRG